MKLHLKHFYFSDTAWRDIKDVLTDMLKGHPELDEYDGIVLTHESNLADTPFLTLEKEPPDDPR